MRRSAVPGDELSAHQEFEELCALAVIGEISAEEAVRLRAHLKVCEACRASGWEFEQIVNQQLPFAGPLPSESFAEKARFVIAARGYRERFAMRAAREGIHLPTSRAPNRIVLALATCAAALVIGVLGYKLFESSARNRELATRYQALARAFDSLDKLEQNKSGPPPAMPIHEAAPASQIHDDSQLRAQLERTRTEAEETQRSARDLREQLARALSDLAALRTEIAASRTGETQASTKLRETELALDRVSSEAAQLRRGRQDDTGKLSAQQTRMRELEDQVATYATSLDRERKLLTADRDIRDLMGARNLHIVDVYDVDGKGKNRPAFGRVFYTEAKSLIFYAFDLDSNRKSVINANFQAWGRRESKAESVQALGIFYVDDQKQNRWVLKFDDPKVLAQIDAVFVTIEPPGGSEKPHGQRLLYAYLNANANHP
jgi:hypothetical protein